MASRRVGDAQPRVHAAHRSTAVLEARLVARRHHVVGEALLGPLPAHRAIEPRASVDGDGQRAYVVAIGQPADLARR